MIIKSCPKIIELDHRAVNVQTISCQIAVLKKNVLSESENRLKYPFIPICAICRL